MTTVGIPAQKDRNQQPHIVAWRLRLGVGTFGYAYLSPAMPNVHGAQLQLQHLDFDTGGECLRFGSTSADRHRLDVARHHALRQLRAQDHLVSWRERSRPAHSRTLIVLSTRWRNSSVAMTAAQNFSRFYPVPNMDHCTGGATTDGFDFLTPLVNWVEKARRRLGFRRPARTSMRRPTRWWAITSPGRSSTRPTTRSRLLCPYPQQARFTGKVSLVNGVPVASNPSDLASAANYACINFVQTATHDFNGDGKSDVLWRDTRATSICG